MSDLWRGQDGVREDAFLVPLAMSADLPTGVSLLLARAPFRLPAGIELQGLLVYDPIGQDVYAVPVLIGRESYSFNKYLPEASFEEVLALAVRDSQFTLWLGGGF